MLLRQFIFKIPKYDRQYVRGERFHISYIGKNQNMSGPFLRIDKYNNVIDKNYLLGCRYFGVYRYLDKNIGYYFKNNRYGHNYIDKNYYINSRKI